MGVPAERVSFGLRLDEACAREGVSVDDYVARYDASLVRPFPGVTEMLAALPRWAVCSNKLGVAAREELDLFGWAPDVALFAEAFGGPKRLGPVLDELGATPGNVLFVGDSEHDRTCAHEAGVRFALAGWNARAVAAEGDVVLNEPADVLRLVAERSA